MRRLCNERLVIESQYQDGIYIRRGCVEDRPTNEETGYLIKFTRLLAAYKPAKPLRVPTEIILQIFKISALEAKVFNSSRLNVIVRCLADRRTLGEVNSQVVPMDAAVLYRKCLGALKRLE
jgi:hypothetical protein